jgi:thiol-disulfide isomerase/thioredoxin
MTARTTASLIMMTLMLALPIACTEKGGRQSGGAAADFTLQDLNGKSVSLSGLRGKTVLLEFWATWCPPCRASVPDIEKIHLAYKDKGVVVLAVSVDDDGWDGVRTFVRQNGITYTVLQGNEEVMVKYQVRSIPMLLIVDREGVVARRYYGFGSDEELEKDLKAVLAPPARSVERRGSAEKNIS